MLWKSRPLSEKNVISFKLVPMTKEDSVVIATGLTNLLRRGTAPVSHCLLTCMSEVKY